MYALRKLVPLNILKVPLYCFLLDDSGNCPLNCCQLLLFLCGNVLVNCYRLCLWLHDYLLFDLYLHQKYKVVLESAYSVSEPAEKDYIPSFPDYLTTLSVCTFDIPSGQLNLRIAV